MNSCGASPREEQDNCLCVGCYYILDHSLSGLFILRRSGARMDSLDFLQNNVVKELKEKGFELETNALSNEKDMIINTLKSGVIIK